MSSREPDRRDAENRFAPIPYPEAGVDDGLKFSFEFFPPKNARMEEALWNTLRRLQPLNPRFVSVTYGAGGSTRERTHNIVRKIRNETGLQAAAHLTCVAATREEVDEVARGYWDAGIRHIVALRGDPPGDQDRYAPHPGGYANAAELVEGLRKIGDFEISVAAYPEKHPDSSDWDADLDNLKRKVDAGATRAITQYFFDADDYLRFLERARAAGIELEIVPGVLTINSFPQCVKFSAMCGATVHPWLHRLFEGLEEDPETARLVALNLAAEQCRTLRANGVDSFHFYTLNRAELTYAVCHILGVRPTLKEAAE
ncbi:MAG: methylenetetrahydrofolate reductase [NAD(P)H] [Acetobacterales bacterium]